MILTRREILAAIKTNELAFTPEIDAYQLQPHAVDLRLGYEFKLPKTWILGPEGRKALNVDPLDANGVNLEQITLSPGQYFELLPKEFIIASTLEEIAINSGKLMAVLYPRSSINRRGLAVDLSGIIDVGYKGKLMIPIINNTDQQIIRVYPGERICQVVFSELATELTSEQAQLHGLTQAKYHQATKLDSKMDSVDEIGLIKQGKLADLKKQFKLDLSNK